MFTYVIYRSMRTGMVIACLKVYTNLSKNTGISYSVNDSNDSKATNERNIRAYQCDIAY